MSQTPIEDDEGGGEKVSVNGGKAVGADSCNHYRIPPICRVPGAHGKGFAVCQGHMAKSFPCVAYGKPHTA